VYFSSLYHAYYILCCKQNQSSEVTGKIVGVHCDKEVLLSLWTSSIPSRSFDKQIDVLVKPHQGWNALDGNVGTRSVFAESTTRKMRQRQPEKSATKKQMLKEKTGQRNSTKGREKPKRSKKTQRGGNERCLEFKASKPIPSQVHHIPLLSPERVVGICSFRLPSDAERRRGSRPKRQYMLSNETWMLNMTNLGFR
jgi:hypothetical protein